MRLRSQHFHRHLGCLNWVQQLARRENHMACGTMKSQFRKADQISLTSFQAIYCDVYYVYSHWFVICHDLSVSNTFKVRGHQTVPDFRKPEPVSNTTENFCSGFPTSEVSRNSSKEAVHSPLLSFASEEVSWILKYSDLSWFMQLKSFVVPRVSILWFPSKIEHSTATEPK